jgi:hypothetical protein
MKRTVKDTSPDATLRQVEILRKLTGAERLRTAFEMSDMARELSLTRLRDEHPDWSEARLKRELLRYAFLPDDLPERLR